MANSNSCPTLCGLVRFPLITALLSMQQKMYNHYMKRNSLPHKPEYSNRLILKIVRSRWLSLPFGAHIFCFILIFGISQILWLPTGAAIVLTSVIISSWASSYLQIDIIKIVDASDNLKQAFPIVLGLLIMTPMFLSSCWLLKRLNHTVLNGLSAWVLIFIAGLSIYTSYSYFIYSIRDWWLVN